MKLPPTFTTHEPDPRAFIDTLRADGLDGLRIYGPCETYYDYWERTNTGPRPPRGLPSPFSWQFTAYENQPSRHPANGLAYTHLRAFTLFQVATHAKFRFKQIRRDKDNLVSVYSVHIPESDRAVGTFNITRKKMRGKEMYQAVKIAVMLAVAASFLGLSACEDVNRILTGDGGDDVGSTDGYVITGLPIVDVLGMILESHPPQIHLLVTGQLTDSCTTLHETRELRQGNDIRIHMTTKRPIDLVCAAVVTEIEHVVPLGVFDPGQYEMIVNGFAITVDVD